MELFGPMSKISFTSLSPAPNEKSKILLNKFQRKIRNQLNQKIEEIIKSSNGEITENIDKFIATYRKEWKKLKKIQIIFISCLKYFPKLTKIASSQTLFEKFFNNETKFNQIENLNSINCYINSQDINHINKITLKMIKKLSPV
jgi:hypothetical protein